MNRTQLISTIREKKSFLCIGLDTDSTKIPKHLLKQADPVFEFNRQIIEATHDLCVAYKPNLAFYEADGVKGLQSLEKTMQVIPSNCFSIADAKRGDIAHSAAAYAEAWLSPDAPLAADALTVNAAIGEDALAAMTDIAHASNGQIYALVHTSNPGAVAVQAQTLADGRPWWHLIADMVTRSGAGAVTGATHTDTLHELRAQLPLAPLLVPVVGAQGAAVGDLLPLVSSAAPPILVAASRSLLPDAPMAPAAFSNAVHARVRDLSAETARELLSETGSRGVRSPA
jgi:orotidine-5'-phosphate decarboxylase